MSADPRRSLLLALADDELILGHRLSEWTGWVPYIEEDLALSSIAQDEMAHARMLYELCAAVDPSRDVDALALGRAPEEYRNAILCERPNRDFAYTLARHWFYERADAIRLDALAGSGYRELAELVAIFQLEERYHRDHAETWLARLAGGPVEARHRIGSALADVFAEARGLFEPIQDEGELLADGVLPEATAVLEARWTADVRGALAEVGLEHVIAMHLDAPGEMIPTSSGEIEPEVSGAIADGTGGRAGKHSEDFLPLWEEMTALYRAHPGARW